MLGYYLHDLSPFVLEFGRSNGQGWGIRWYGVSYLLGFVAAYVLLWKLARDKILRIPPERVPDLVLNACIWGVLVGGRLGHVFFYEPSLLWNVSEGAPWWGVLKVWHGGMSAHGGIIGVILTLIIFARRNRYSVLNLGDAACMVVPLGLMFGRIANFINGELYGDKANLPWAVQFPTEITAPTNDQPDAGVVQRLPEAMGAIQQHIDTVMAGLRLGDKPVHEYDLTTLVQSPQAFLGKGVPASTAQEVRQFVEQQLATVLPARHPSQLYEALLEGVLLFLICWMMGRLWRKDGMAAGAFLTFYPVMRIIGEQFRVGDAPPGWLAWTHQSQGVLLSLVMLGAGLTFWILWMRRPKGAVVESTAARPGG